MPDSAAWTLSDIAPNDNTFRDAGEAVHREFWRYIASIGVDRFHWRCNQGIGASGEPLTPIAASTARRGRKRSYTGLGNAGNPPLVPALGLSRTARRYSMGAGSPTTPSGSGARPRDGPPLGPGDALARGRRRRPLPGAERDWLERGRQGLAAAPGRPNGGMRTSTEPRSRRL